MISELTETTEPAVAVPFRGWIFYDGDCSSCRELAHRSESMFARHGFRFRPLQQEWVLRRLKLTREEALEEMRLLTNSGEVFGGADAVIQLARRIWWAAPLARLARLQPIHALLHRTYRWVAARRSCAINSARPISWSVRTRWLGLAVLPFAALGARPLVPAWAFMWLMAFALFMGCKWLTLGRVSRRVGRVCPSASWPISWPGRGWTQRVFCRPTSRRRPRPRRR